MENQCGKFLCLEKFHNQEHYKQYPGSEELIEDNYPTILMQQLLQSLPIIKF
jgi:hypothetical protein